MHVFLSYVLSLICEAVLCLELIFVELGQAHYKKKYIYLLLWSLHAGAVLRVFGLSVIVFECSRRGMVLGDC